MMKIKQILFTSLLSLVLSTSLYAQSIKGTINDNEGMPLPGATIINLNTSNGVSTDFDGQFSIEASLDDVLQISYIGFETFDFKISGEPMKVGVVAKLNEDLNYEIWNNVTESTEEDRYKVVKH